MRKKYSGKFAIFSLAIFLLSQFAPLQVIYAEVSNNQDSDNTFQVTTEGETKPQISDESVITEISQKIISDDISVETIDPKAIEEVVSTTVDDKTSYILAGQKYFSNDGQANIVFNTLPEGNFTIEIENVETPSEVSSQAVTPAYKFTTTPELPSGSFSATITLPLVKSVDVDMQVAYSEDGENFVKDDSSLLVSSNTISFDVDHFTVFVVVAPSASTTEPSVGTISWVNSANVYVQDGNNARTDNLNNETSQYLIATNFGLTLDPNVDVEGIELRVVRSPRFGGDANGIFDNSIRLVKNGVIVGDDNANTSTRWPNGNSTAVYGSPTDLWGESWDFADLNSSDFGIAISVTQPAGDITQRARIDYIEFTIYYNTRPEVTLTSPNGGQLYRGGSIQQIEWVATDADLDTLTVDLEYSTDNGSSWSTIASGLSNTGAFPWTVANVDSDDVLVRITVFDGTSSTYDISDSVFEVDSLAPYLEVTNIVDGGYTNENIIELRGTVTDKNLFRYFYSLRDSSLVAIASQTITSSLNIVDQGLYTFNATAYPDGVYHFSLRGRDIGPSGNASEINTTFTIDRVVPDVTFNDDVEAGGVQSDTINVTVSDLNLAAYEYGFSADAVCDGSDTYGNAFSSGVDFSINDESQNGNYICIRATDMAGNVSYSVSSNPLNIDNTPPTIGTVTAVTTYASQFVRGNGAGFHIRMNASDLNGIATCDYSLDGGATWVFDDGVNVYYNTVPATNRCEAFDVNAADGELLTITMRATDTAGNTSVGTSIIRTADSQAPTVSSFVITPVVGSFTSTNPTLEFTVTDTVSPINRCEYRYRVTGSGGAGWSAWTLATIVTPGTTADCSASIAGLADGTSYDFQVRGRDSANRNSVTSTLTYIVDGTIPSTVFTSPTTGSYWNSPITLSGNSTDANGIDFVELQYSPAGAGTWTTITTLDNVVNDSPYTWSYVWTPGAEGIYDIRALATDSLGNTDSTSTVLNVTYDVTDPVVGITLPTHNSFVRGTVEVRGSVNDTNPWRYYTVVRNSSNVVVAGPGTVYDSNSFTDQLLFNWNTTLLADGTYYVHLAARDLANNRGAVSEQTITVYVDNTAPVTVLNPYGATHTNNTTPTFTGTATDNLSNVVSVEYRYINNSDVTPTWSGWILATAVDGSFDSNSEDFTFTTAALTDGDYTFQTRATDGVGNIEVIVDDASQQSLIIDTVPPVVTVNYLETRNRRPALTGTVDDPTATILVTVDGNTYAGINNGDGTWRLPVNTINPALPDAHYNVEVSATDLAGNVGTDITVLDLVVDRTAPNLSINSISFGDYISGPFVLEGMVSDPDLTDGNPGTGIDTVFAMFMRTSSGPLVIRVCTAAYDAMADSYSIDVNSMAGCELPDGQYMVMVTALDNVNNIAVRSVLRFTIDNVIPTVTSLADATFAEGSALPVISITGVDNVRISELCFEVTSSPLGAFGLNCLSDDGNVNASYTWDLSDYVSYPYVDTSMFPEGAYEFSYFAVDRAGNSSVVENVVYTIVNVPPIVTFGSNQTINEGESATFSASFSDPSSNDSGDMIFDDANWSATVDYGDGSAVVNLGDFTTPGTITIPNHAYVFNGTYTATLEVCEEDPVVNSASEGECTAETVTITVNNVVPSVLISASPSTSVLSGTNVTLTADVSANTMPGNQIVSYSWAGDCSGTGSTFVLATPTARAYNCSVTVTDVDGDIATANTTISASNGVPSVVIIANPGVNVTAGTTVTLIGNILGGDANFTYVWSAACSGSGTNSGGLTNTTTVPSTPGSYYCRIDVTDANGDTAAAGVIVAVNNAPTSGGGGVGGTGEVQGANTEEDVENDIEKTNEEEEKEDEGAVLGALTCDSKQEMSGKVQNKDNSDGVENVTVIVYYFENNQRVQVGRVVTNANGEWKIEVCPGQYNVEIDESTLPSGATLDSSSAKVLSVSVNDNTETQNVNFNIMFEAGFNWLVIIIPLLILLILFIMFLLSRRREEE